MTSIQTFKNIPILFWFLDCPSIEFLMALNDLLWNHLHGQIKVVQSITKALVTPSSSNVMEHIVSLINILGHASRMKRIQHVQPPAKSTSLLKQMSPPIESVNGIGKKLGAKLRSFGIYTVADLKKYNPQAFKIPGISQNRILKWQSSV